MEDTKPKPPPYSIAPDAVMYCDTLEPMARLLYISVASIARQGKGVCKASNAYFAKRFNRSERAVSGWLNNLVLAKLIAVDFEKNDCSKRRITLLDLSSFLLTPLEETCNSHRRKLLKATQETSEALAGNCGTPIYMSNIKKETLNKKQESAPSNAVAPPASNYHVPDVGKMINETPTSKPKGQETKQTNNALLVHWLFQRNYKPPRLQKFGANGWSNQSKKRNHNPRIFRR